MTFRQDSPYRDFPARSEELALNSGTSSGRPHTR